MSFKFDVEIKLGHRDNAYFSRNRLSDRGKQRSSFSFRFSEVALLAQRFLETPKVRLCGKPLAERKPEGQVRIFPKNHKIWKKLDRYGKPGINVTLKNISTQAFFGFFQIAHLRGFGMPVRQCWFLSLILFGSGFSELLFQTVWLREFRLIFGCSTPASAAVLGVFMAGLGAGGLFFGRKADRSHDPLKLYSRLEIGAACLVVFSPFLVTSQKRGARAPLRLAK